MAEFGEGLMTLRKITILCTSLAVASLGMGQDMSNEEFTDADFEKFFGLIEDGKISREEMLKRCENEVIGFTFAGLNLVHKELRERIDYNQTRVTGSMDGRVMRSRHFNASFGEWTGSVFKPLCAGMWSMTIDVDATPNTRIELYVRRPGQERPGEVVVGSNTGHLTLVMPLGTGDEVSTWSSARGDDAKRRINQATFTAYKVGHIEKYMTEFDEDAWNADIEALR
jgi:hypothetical protein